MTCLAHPPGDRAVRCEFCRARQHAVTSAMRSGSLTRSAFFTGIHRTPRPPRIPQSKYCWQFSPYSIYPRRVTSRCQHTHMFTNRIGAATQPLGCRYAHRGTTPPQLLSLVSTQRTRIPMWVLSSFWRWSKWPRRCNRIVTRLRKCPALTGARGLICVTVICDLGRRRMVFLSRAVVRRMGRIWVEIRWNWTRRRAMARRREPVR